MENRIVSNILIWSKEIGFIRINEGNGSNLLDEDESKGYVDYIMVDYLDYDGYDLVETDGTQSMLKEMYQDKFKDAREVIKYLIDCSWIPDAEYTILYGDEE